MRFGLLGPLMVLDSAGAPIPVLPPQLRMMLGVLLLAANRPVPRDAIEAALWPEQPPPTARSSVNNLAAQLRRALRPNGAPRLETTSAGYQLRVLDGELDTEAFLQLLREARAGLDRADWEGAIRATDSAAALWRGAPLADLPMLAEQHAPFVEHLSEVRLQALEWNADALLELGRPDDAVLGLTRPAAANPLREALHRRLILGLYRSGRPADSLAAYERLRRTLADELGTDPDAELQEIRQRILISDPTLLLRNDHPTRTALPVPSQLPRTLVDFSGRESHLEILREGLAPATGAHRAAVRVFAISGAGGIGKTTLAVQAAHRAAAEFPDGQLYADLRGAGSLPRNPIDVLGAFLRDLGLPGDAVPVDLEGRASAFRSLVSHRRMLFVLDNALDTAQVRPLLPGSGLCAVLVTSRRRMPGLAGARHLVLEPMADEAARALFTAIVGPERIRAEPDATEKVLAFCAGLPLALRVAAARLAGRPAWTVGTIAAKLADVHHRLDELRVEDQAVRTSFQMSYARLLPAELYGAELRSADPSDGHRLARAFRLFGIIPNTDMGLHAAAALLDDTVQSTEALLEELVDACLLENPRPQRYRMHDLLRVFAAERSQAEDGEADRAAAVDRITRWYLDGLIEADSVLFPNGPRPERPWPGAGRPEHRFAGIEEAAAWCETERANFACAALIAADRDLHATAWNLALFSWSFLHLRSYLDDWFALAETAVRGAKAAGDAAAVASALTARGASLMVAGHIDDARPDLLNALAIRVELGDVPGQIACLTNLGAVEMQALDLPAADGFLTHALTLCDGTELLHRKASVLWNLGACRAAMGDRHGALACFAEARDLYRNAEDLFGEAHAVAAIAESRLHLGDLAGCEESARTSLAMSRQIGSAAVEALSLALLIQVMGCLDQLADTRELREQTLELLARLPTPAADRVRAILALPVLGGDG